MDALTILIIRHAEKPLEARPGPGLTKSGTPDDKSLVIRGWQRAGAWVALFGSGMGGENYPTPQAIYAAKPGNGPAGQGPSRRAFETVELLGERLGMPVKTKHAQGDETSLVGDVLKLSGVVLISWEHRAIVEGIVPRIPVKSGSVPTKWPRERFDVVLRFDRQAGEENFTFREFHPQLFPGNLAQPLGH